MRVLEVEKYKEFLYIGTLNGEEYRKVGIAPIQLNSDFFLKEKIEVTVVNTFFEIDEKIYYTTVALDSNNNIVLQDMRKY